MLCAIDFPGQTPCVCILFALSVRSTPKRQEEALRWLAEAHIRAEETQRLNNGLPPVEPGFAALMPRLLQRYGCSPGKISARGCELNDHLHTAWDEMEVYRLAESAKGAGISVRSKVFARAAHRTLSAMFSSECNAPDDLIHVTCTGYVSPSAAQLLVVEKGWRQRTRVTHAYHMGCYAALPAVRIGSGFLASTTCPSHRVELCTPNSAPCIWTLQTTAPNNLWCRACSPTVTSATP